MAEQIDNITLALVSLKELLASYLDAQGWRRKYTLYLAHDPKLRAQEIVLEATERNQVGLPLIVLSTGYTRNKVVQIGDEYGRDVVSLSLHVMAVDAIELLTLGNLLRRKLEGYVFSILNYRTSLRTVLGKGELERAELIDISNVNADKVQDRHSAVINVTLELNSQSLL